MLDEVGSSVLIVRLNGFEERLQRDVVVDQRLLIDDDVILFDVSAKAEYISDTGYCSQLQFDDPVLNGTQFLIALSTTYYFIKINLTGTSSDRTHTRFEPSRHGMKVGTQKNDERALQPVDVVDAERIFY